MTHYSAIYDFELMPYALGDVLTWNIQTAIRCEELGREKVDIHICLDDRHPASIYQSDMITANNCWLFFNELFGAFGTHPKIGNIFVERRREDAIKRIREIAQHDSATAEGLSDYEHALANRHDQDVLIRYFTKYIYYHKGINAFWEKHGRIPLLQPSMGCTPDVEGLLSRRLADKRVVAIHMRMRRLDAGYRGEHTYVRDSDFLEWYDFLREAERLYPDVQFVVLGRLQEKPLELLRLPNVMSLRTLGLGLGHELSLMLRSDLFIGTSSGFAAMANFSQVPYFITKMGRESCNAYEIEYGAPRLPFATERQILVYEPETRDLLLRLLEKGLNNTPPRTGARKPVVDPAIDVRSWEWERAQWLHPDATTGRYFLDETYRDKETAFLVWPKLKVARNLWRKGLDKSAAWSILNGIEKHFPRMCASFPEFLRLRGVLAADRKDWKVAKDCESNLVRLAEKDKTHERAIRALRRYLVWHQPIKMRIKYIWKNRRYIPYKLKKIFRRYAFALTSRS